MHRLPNFLQGAAFDALRAAMARRADGEAVDLTIVVNRERITIESYDPAVQASEPATGQSGVNGHPGNNGASGSVAGQMEAPADWPDAPLPADDERKGTRYLFELGSHVVLETSRGAYHEQRKFDADQAKRDRAAEDLNAKIGFAPMAYASVAFLPSGRIEEGEVIGRAEYANSPPLYRVRFRGGNGCQMEEWFSDDAIFQPDAEFDEVDDG